MMMIAVYGERIGDLCLVDSFEGRSLVMRLRLARSPCGLKYW